MSQRIAQLIFKHLSGTLDVDERRMFQLWLSQSNDNQVFVNELEEDAVLSKLIAQDFKDQQSNIEQDLLLRAKSQIRFDSAERSRTGRIARMGRWWAAAAAVILLLGASSYWWLTTKENQALKIAGNEIMPGKDGAILTLADGSEILLDSIKNATLVLSEGLKLRIADGVLQYEGPGTAGAYNTITTPKGRQYNLILPDGTTVWLNSDTHLRYPVSFSGPSRRVELTGEAYFDVAKNRKVPFVVDVDGKIGIEVLGTEFNVNAYRNEGAIATTLLEGSIVLSPPDAPDQDRSHVSDRNPNKSSATFLKPGQQAIVKLGSDGTNVDVLTATDVEKAVAWKNGLFDFNDIPFEAAMRQLERWYDIEVIYLNGIPENIDISGEITRGVSLNGLLKVLQKIGVQCTLEGRKLLIQT